MTTTTRAVRDQSFKTVECDIPAGITIAEYRRARRRRARRRRRLAALLRP